MTVVGTLEAELKADPRMWEAAMMRATESMEKLAARAERSSTKLASVSKESPKAAAALQGLQENAKVLGERFSKVGAVTGGMGQAFATAVPQMQGMISGASGLAQAFAAGGPLMLAMSAVGLAVGAIGSAWADSRERGREAAKGMLDDVNSVVEALEKEIARLRQAQKESQLLQLTAGLTPTQAAQVRMVLDTDDAQAELRKFEKRYGLFASNPLGTPAGEYQEMRRNPTAKPEVLLAGVGEQFNRFADALLETYKLLQDKVRETANAGVEKVLAAGAQEPKKTTVEAPTTSAAQPSPAPPIYTAPALSPMQQQALDAGDMPLLERLLDDNGAALESVSVGSLELARQLAGLSESTDLLARGMMGQGAGMNVAKDPDAEWRAAWLRDMADAQRKLRADRRAYEEARANQVADAVAGGISAVGSGRLGTLAATTGLGMAGAALAPTVGLPPPAGEAIGQALGGILGPIADQLMGKLETLKPLMDGLGQVVGALNPIFAVVGEVASRLGEVFVALAPSILSLAQIVAVALVPILRSFEPTIIGMIGFLSLLGAVLQPVAYGFALLVNVLDTGIRFVMDGLIWFMNLLIAGLNIFLGWVEDLTLGAVKFDRLKDIAPTKSMDELGLIDVENALDDNTEALKDVSQSLTNLPAGFRYNLAAYRAENPDGRSDFGGTGGRREMRMGGGSSDGVTINGNVTFALANASIAESIRANMRRYGVPVAAPRGAAPDKKG